MAMSTIFTCNGCERGFEAWDDGNPYYFDANGKKKYAYHPDHENLLRCVGNDEPHLCLGCGHEFPMDSEAPLEACPKCSAPELIAKTKLDGKPCPFCKKGTFRNRGMGAIS